MIVDAELAAQHLAAVDPVMAELIRVHGACDLAPGTVSPFRALSRSIIFQQLSGKAAETIFGRFVAHFSIAPGSEAFPTPEVVLAVAEEALRSAGLSRQKAAAVRSLAEHVAAGQVTEAAFDDLDDEEVIARLTAVRGIGRWTAEMFLMFHLGRPDVLPVNDVGINRAIRTLYGLEELPKPADVLRIGEPWRPWASVACWYLWRSEDVKPPAA